MKAIEMKPIITTPSQYIITIEGMEGVLFDKMPDLSQPKSSGSKQQKLDPMEKEQSTWREKLYFDSENNCYLPGENIHESLKEGAKYWNQTIPGEGKKTYTDLVVSALVVENMDLNLKKDDPRIVAFGKMCNMNPSKGKKSGSKAYVIRPLIRPWGGNFKMSVFDARLSVDVLKIIIAYAGTFKAVGTWRPTYGRFNLIDIKEV
jgi:hypothetical protein